MSKDGLVRRGGTGEAWCSEWWKWRSTGAEPRSLEVLRGPLRSFDSSLLEHVFLAPPGAASGDAELCQVIGLDALVFASRPGEASIEVVEERARTILESVNAGAVLFALSPAEYRLVADRVEVQGGIGGGDMCRGRLVQ